MPAHQGRPQRARCGAWRRRAPPHTETFLARSVHGLEWLGAAEIETDLDAAVLDVGHREIVFRAPLAPAALKLGSIDDLFLLCGKIDDIDRSRIGLRRLTEGLSRLPLVRSLASIESLRPIERTSGFEVIGSFLGRRNFNRTEIECCAGVAISEITSMPFRDHGDAAAPARDVSWRIHMRDNQAVVGLRVARRPLHRRDYRVSSIPGALHPPVAYAMTMLSGAHPGCRIIDPCCGSGTLLIEAGRMVGDAITIGSDSDRNALLAAGSNAMDASCRWVQADVGRMPYADGVADCVVANLPWGRQVLAGGTILHNIEPAVDEVMRILAPGGNAVLLSSLRQSIVNDRFALLWSIPISIAGHWAQIQILCADRDSGWGPVCLRGRYGPSLRRMWMQYGRRVA
jgi:tRNA (guanine6-N2)-methyltransferase